MSKRLEKFTKGLWYLGDFCTIRTRRGAIIADAWHVKATADKEEDPEREANAILISKAPKM